MRPSVANGAAVLLVAGLLTAAWLWFGPATPSEAQTAESLNGRISSARAEARALAADVDEATETRSTIYRMMRITEPENYPALSRIKKHLPLRE